MERRFAWMWYIDIVSSLSRGWYSGLNLNRYVKREHYTKIYRAVLQCGVVENNIVKGTFSLPNNCFPVTKSRLKSL